MDEPGPIEVAPVVVARVASLPWSAVDGLRSPELVSLAVQANGSHDVAEAARSAAAAALERAIGDLPPGEPRRRMVSFRRLFLRDSVTLVGTDISVVALVDESLSTACRDAIDAANREVAAQEVFLDAFRAAVIRERRHLLRTVGTDRFERAVAVAQPQLIPQIRSHLARFGATDGAPTKARHLRLEGTLVNLLLRAAGRPTPSSLWAGVVEGAVPRAERDLRTGNALAARASRERFQVQLDIGHLVEAARFAVGTDISVAHGDCWAWMEDVAAAAPARLAREWRVVAEEARKSFDAVAPPAAVPTVSDWLGLHEVARLGVNRLRNASGMADVDGRSSMRVDWHPPFALTVDSRTVDCVALAIDEWICCQAGWGFGATWARATVEAIAAPGATATVSGTDLPTVTSLVARISGEAQTSHAAALVVQLEAAIAQSAGGWLSPTVRPGIVGSDRPGPWGSALVVVGDDCIEVRSVRGEPALFLARWPSLVPGAIVAAASLVAATGLPCRSVRFTRYANPAAALGAFVAPTVAAEDLRPSRVDQQHMGLVVQELHGESTAVIPVFDNAAAPVPTSDLEFIVFRAGGTWGWELVASGMPLLPHEIEVTGHLPELCGPGGTSVHPERWLLSVDELAACAAPAAAEDRFRSWQRLILLRGLPDCLLVRLAPSPNAPTRLVPTNSILAVEAFLRDVGPDGGAIDGIVVAMPGPERGSLLVAEDGERYVGELAVTFVDHRFGVRADGERN